MSIDRTVERLIKNNPFYKKLYGNTENIVFENLPIIDKNTVIENYDSICTNSENAIFISTSGTTGQPLVVPWTERDYLYSNLYTWKMRQKWYGITPASRYCTFHIDTEFGMQPIALLNGGRTLSLGKYRYSDEILKNYIRALKEFEPEWILGPASIVYMLLVKMRDMEVCLDSLRYIELNGEYVSDEMYNEIKELCNVTIGNLYGSTEFNGIALRCPYGKMHILENCVYVENSEPGVESKIIITGLVNSSMPLIRYNLGDVGLVADILDCPCGLCGKELNIKYGRQAEVIKSASGRPINASVFSSLIYKLNIEKRIALQYCVDIRDDQYILQLLVSPEHMDYAKRQIFWMKRELLRLGIDFEVEVYSELKDILDCDGKFTFVKRHNMKVVDNGN